MNVICEKTAFSGKDLKKAVKVFKASRAKSKSVGMALKRHASTLKQIPGSVKKDAVGSLKSVTRSQRSLRKINKDLLAQEKPSFWNIPKKITNKHQMNKTKSLLSDAKKMKSDIASGKKIPKTGLLNTPGKKMTALVAGGAGLYGSGVVSGSQRKQVERKYDSYYQ